MKTLVTAFLLLAIAAVASPIGLSYAQMPEQAQENVPEQTNEVLTSLDNFGVEVADFVRNAMSEFQDQRELTILQIKDCRAKMMEAEPSERSQVRQECRSSLDGIREDYREIRGAFQDTFKEFRESIEVLRNDAQGEQVSDEDRQAAIDDIRETAKSRHLEIQTGQNGMDVEQLREKMKSAHRGP